MSFTCDGESRWKHIEEHGHGGFLGWLKRIFDPQVVMHSSSGPQIFVRLVFDGTYLRRRYVAAQLNPKWADLIRVEGVDQVVETDDGFTRFEFPADDPPLKVLGAGELKLYLCYGGPWFYAIHFERQDRRTKLIDVSHPSYQKGLG